MTEQEWLECADPKKMLEFLGDKASSRKLRLFSCGNCWRFCDVMLDKRSLNAIEWSEAYADGKTTISQLNGAWELAMAANDPLPVDSPKKTFTAIALYCADPNPVIAAMGASQVALFAENDGDASLWYGGSTTQCRLIRCIFDSHLFRRLAVDCHCLTSTVCCLAEAIYEERAFDRLPILADALEDAGFTGADLLNHLREPGVHCRGCWPLDLILGKE